MSSHETPVFKPKKSVALSGRVKPVMTCIIAAMIFTI